MAEQKYYAVKKGRAPGIYDSWTDCKEQIFHFSGAIYKSFTSREAAEEYLQTTETEKPINENLPFAYIDGSYSKKNNLYSWGGFIDDREHIYILQGTGSNPEYLKEWNIAGELIGALQVLFKCSAMGIPEINIYHDCAAIKEYITGAWKTKTPLAIYYRDTTELLSNDTAAHYIPVKGHTGIQGNELADYLAKEAAGIQLLKRQEKALQEFRAEANKRKGG